MDASNVAPLLRASVTAGSAASGVGVGLGSSLSIKTSTKNEQKPGLPTLHHLNNSQSQRLLWLLEELDVEYNIVVYTRDPKTHRAPPELAEVHPLGKSPILVTADGRIVVETAAIAGYLIRTFDKEEKYTSKDIVKDEALTAFSGAGLGFWSILALLFDVASRGTPWPLSYIPGLIESTARKNLIDIEFKKALTYLEGELWDEDWFNGKEPDRSDFMLSFPLEQIIQKEWVNVKEEHPRLDAWRGRILERPVWKRGIEKGNGFDLKF